MFQKVDHIGIVVADLDEAVTRYERVYGVSCRHVETLDELSVRIAYLPVGEVTLELAEPIGEGGRVARFLREHGEGFHHLAFRVEDLNASLAQLSANGVELRDPEPRRGGEGSRVAFIEPDETHRVLTELVERPGE